MKISRIRFFIFCLVSLLLHGGFFLYLFKEYQEGLERLAIQEKLNRSKILVDLTDPMNDPYDPNKKVISRFDYAGKGKLAPEDGQHLSGDFNPISIPEQNSLDKSQRNKSIEEEQSKKRRKLLLEGGDIANQMQLPVNSKKKNITPDTVTETGKKKNSQKQKLSIDTENTLVNRFWFDESEYLQIDTRSHSDAEFNLELANLLKKRFSTYVMSGGGLNFYMVKRDEVTVLAHVDYLGRIAFDKIVSPSKTQPYFNYLAMSVVDDPGVVEHLPAELKGGVEKLKFFFNIRFTGEPLRKWWMGFEFLADSSRDE